MKNTTLVLITIAVISGCGGNPKKVIFNDDNPTMESIMTGRGSATSTYSYQAHGQREALAHNGTTNPDQNPFRELDNPTIFLYIEPHVTQNGTYIPGMTVPFKRHTQVEFALPGEL